MFAFCFLLLIFLCLLFPIVRLCYVVYRYRKRERERFLGQPIARAHHIDELFPTFSSIMHNGYTIDPRRSKLMSVCVCVSHVHKFVCVYKSKSIGTDAPPSIDCTLLGPFVYTFKSWEADTLPHTYLATIFHSFLVTRGLMRWIQNYNFQSLGGGFLIHYC